MKSLFIDGPAGRLHVQDTQGQGPSVLLLHGNSSAGAAFAAQCQALGQRYRLLAVDLPGHGQSAPVSPEHYSFAGFAAVLSTLVATLQLKDYAIVGHSLGGHAALEALPQLTGLRALVLLGAPPFNAELAGRLFRPEPTGGLVFKGSLSDTERERLAVAFVAPSQRSAQRAAKLDSFIAQTDPHVRDALGKALAQGQFADEWALLQASQVPALLIQGDDDAFIDAEACSALAGAALQVRRVPNCGHCPHVEASALCNAWLAEFFQDTL